MHINEIPFRGDIAKIVGRFESRYIPEPTSGCWLWFAAADAKGYGRMNLGGGIYVKAHRLSYVLFKGPLDFFALHRCDNPACVNPNHLFDGSWRENTQDSWNKGRRAHIRTPVGEANKKTSLNNEQVYEVRARMARGEKPEALAPEYGVTGATLYNIKNGVTWRHLLPS